MVLLLILVALSCFNGVFSLAQKELLSLKRLTTTPVPARFSHTPKDGATILEMKHIKHLQKGLTLDVVRVESIQSRIKNVVSGHVESSQAHVPISSGIQLQTLNYIVIVTLGIRNLTVIVDTGSDLSWVQCQPCRLCYTQPEPLFNPLVSPSYRSVQCNSQPCHTPWGARQRPAHSWNDSSREFRVWMWKKQQGFIWCSFWPVGTRQE